VAQWYIKTKRVFLSEVTGGGSPINLTPTTAPPELTPTVVPP
jgi:hypothetical protein